MQNCKIKFCHSRRRNAKRQQKRSCAQEMLFHRSCLFSIAPSNLTRRLRENLYIRANLPRTRSVQLPITVTGTRLKQIYFAI
ncbi:hypothetical protein PSE_1782 [Pseudovibrio sp. FO-BEG1]|nr:hypothetical protein PSE_1782 [Pseudovibrio sp. FO-BEG1]